MAAQGHSSLADWDRITGSRNALTPPTPRPTSAVGLLCNRGKTERTTPPRPCLRSLYGNESTAEPAKPRQQRRRWPLTPAATADVNTAWCRPGGHRASPWRLFISCTFTQCIMPALNTEIKCHAKRQKAQSEEIKQTPELESNTAEILELSDEEF